jgi:hypothetical protein
MGSLSGDCAGARSLLAATLQAAGVQLRLDLKKHYTFKSSMGTYIDDMVHKAKSIDHF